MEQEETSVPKAISVLQGVIPHLRVPQVGLVAAGPCWYFPSQSPAEAVLKFSSIPQGKAALSTEIQPLIQCCCTGTSALNQTGVAELPQSCWWGGKLLLSPPEGQVTQAGHVRASAPPAQGEIINSITNEAKG